MKQFLYTILIFLTVLACSTEQEDLPTLEIGQEFTDSNVRVLTIDTFTVALSTFKFDSIIVDDANRLLVGRYVDETFGPVSASTFFEMIPSSYNIEEDGVLDSVALILHYDNYFYNDTTQTSQINIHRLLDDVKPDDDFFYNTSTIEYDPIPLATTNYIPEPFDEDSIQVTLPLVFGEELFRAIRNGNIANDSELTNEFKGLTVQPGATDNASIIGFDSSFEKTYLRFFYIVEDEFGTEEFTYDLVVNPTTTATKKFNNINSDVSNTYFEGLNDQEIGLQSENSDHKSFMQAGKGIAIKLQLPSIKNLLDIPGTGTILNANLQLYIPREEINENLPIRDSLRISILDQNNDEIGFLLNSAVAVNGILNKENSEFNADFYEVPIAPYIEQKLNEDYNIDDALAIYPRDFTGSVDRLIVNGQGSDNFNAKLILTYAIYDE